MEIVINFDNNIKRKKSRTNVKIRKDNTLNVTVYHSVQLKYDLIFNFCILNNVFYFAIAGKSMNQKTAS